MTDHDPAATPTQPVRHSGRRRLLQALALGGASAAVLPEKWVRPVIDAVIVPAHAQGSIVHINGIYSNVQNGIGAVPGSFMERLANFVVPSAHAQAGNPFANLEQVHFDCRANPNVQVRYYNSYSSLCETMPTTIFANNVIQDVKVGTYTFFNLLASPSTLTGQVSGGWSPFLDAAPFTLTLTDFMPGCNVA